MSNIHLNVQPDFIFSIVRAPKSWTPAAIDDVPPRGIVISRVAVARFDEAHDDWIRCNELALKQGLREWAVLQTAEAGA